MQELSLLLFDDGHGRFNPLTDRRPVFDLRTGGLTTRQRIERLLGKPTAAIHVPRRLATVMREREPALAVNPRLHEINQHRNDREEWLLVNGRWLGIAGADEVRSLTLGQTLRTAAGDLLAARLRGEDAQATLAAACLTAPGEAAGPDAGRGGDEVADPPLITRPWHILRSLEQTLRREIEEHEGPDVAEDAKVHPTAVLDTSRGPIIIEARATIGPLAVLEGPCWIGADSTVQPHSLIRANVAVGPICKVAGEISFSVIHGHSNKAHAGFLGHALVGEWVNLGADTTASNLKNTYGEVRVQLPSPPCEARDGIAALADRGDQETKTAAMPSPPSHERSESTGLTFHGPILGDFVRTAIGTRLPTGAAIGTGVMLASARFAPKTADAFGFYVDEHGQQRKPYDLEKFLDTARAMMARRGLTLTPAEEALLRDLHRTTA